MTQPISTHDCFADLYLAVEVSDDDVTLAEVASQCGYDFSHSLVDDVAEPVEGQWHDEPCLLLRLTLSAPLSAVALDALAHNGTVQLSHPSVAFVRVLGIQPSS